MIPLGVIKFLIPLKTLRASFTKIIIKIGELWISVNSSWVIYLHKPHIEVIGKENLKGDSWFLSTSNHQSAADIFIVQYITNKKIPMLKFFIKYELIYVPVIGICWWALDMPFLKRYTQKQIKKNPKLEGRDYKKMKKSLEHYSLHPVSIFSYAEGTRFTKKKHSLQKSEYVNLLKPKEGGLAIALSNINKIKELMKSKNITKAKIELEIELEKNPYQVNLLTIATDIYRASGDHRKSLEYSEHLITHHPENWIGYLRTAKDLIYL